ncbi:MAG: lipid-A-disaccharide synthase N-terminal domain-containing protein [Xanthomonadales bacterium]|nr:lipid-A-disaccharide synthase N-terminal domain-containing protein [Xanthomonadales bacterium]
MNECIEAGSGFLRPLLDSLVGSWLYADSYLWTAVGFAGAAVFGSRFLFQWLHSEKEKALVVPWYFWHLSFWGSTLNFIYAMHLDKAPLIVGSMFLPVLYGRNLFLLYKGGRQHLRH